MRRRALIGLVLLYLLPLSAREVQTYLPVVNLTFSALSRDTFSACTFTLIEGDKTSTLKAAIRHRGASALIYTKQSYAIKLYDEDGVKMDTSLLQMREDNYWILDAMAIDKARMRNRVAMDLWLDFSSKPYYFEKEPTMKNTSDGKFVEVYVNGEYSGIYCLMERVDRKQLKLKKAENNKIRGVLYKSVDWAGTFFSEGETEAYDNTSREWMRFEYEYPEEEDNLITWEPLANAMDFAVNASTENFVQHIAEKIDLPVYLDYELFALALSARDNRGKNVYLSFYNINKAAYSKVLFTPWDIDHSFGRDYKADEEEIDRMKEWSITLQTRLMNEYPNYKEQRLDRYAYLRENFFKEDSLVKRFEAYFDLFHETGAAEREEERWSGVDKIELDFESEKDFIASWIPQRIAYVDSLIGYKADDSDVENCEAAIARPQKLLQDGTLYILFPNGTAYTVIGSRIK